MIHEVRMQELQKKAKRNKARAKCRAENKAQENPNQSTTSKKGKLERVHTRKEKAHRLMKFLEENPLSEKLTGNTKGRFIEVKEMRRELKGKYSNEN